MIQKYVQSMKFKIHYDSLMSENVKTDMFLTDNSHLLCNKCFDLMISDIQNPLVHCIVHII